jgi:predicted PurR-regulated permease PerM
MNNITPSKNTVEFVTTKMSHFLLTSKDMSNIFLHVVFIATFIVVFFFTYVVHIEEEIIKHQIDLIVVNLTRGKKLLDPETQLSLKTMINESTSSKSKEDKEKEMRQDNSVAESNKKILTKATYTMGIFIIVCIIASYLLFRYHKSSLTGDELANASYSKLLMENVFILMFVAVTEFAFVHLISLNYVYGDSNFVIKEILTSLKDVSK